jgi:hypothetical protein
MLSSKVPMPVRVTSVSMTMPIRYLHHHCLMNCR